MPQSNKILGRQKASVFHLAFRHLTQMPWKASVLPTSLLNEIHLNTPEPFAASPGSTQASGLPARVPLSSCLSPFKNDPQCHDLIIHRTSVPLAGLWLPVFSYYTSLWGPTLFFLRGRQQKVRNKWVPILLAHLFQSLHAPGIVSLVPLCCGSLGSQTTA